MLVKTAQPVAIRAKDVVAGADDGITKLARLTGDWDKGSISVVFAEQVMVVRGGGRWWRYDLLTGEAQPKVMPSPLTVMPPPNRGFAPASPEPYDIEPRTALIKRRENTGFMRRDASHAHRPVVDLTIYVNRWFAIGDPAHDDLDVARDAWFGGDVVRATEIAGKSIPHSYELWLACIKIEFALLQERTAASGR